MLYDVQHNTYTQHVISLSIDNICFQDIQGSKIIPIIVGSVIGAGVIVVLIIYIVSLVWNYIKKKRSATYETLSTQ